METAMTRLTVELGARSYPILISEGLLDELGAHVAPLLKRPRTMIVTDTHVADAYLAKLAHTHLDELSRIGPLLKRIPGREGGKR